MFGSVAKSQHKKIVGNSLPNILKFKSEVNILITFLGNPKLKK